MCIHCFRFEFNPLPPFLSNCIEFRKKIDLAIALSMLSLKAFKLNIDFSSALYI